MTSHWRPAWQRDETPNWRAFQEQPFHDIAEAASRAVLFVLLMDQIAVLRRDNEIMQRTLRSPTDGGAMDAEIAVGQREKDFPWRLIKPSRKAP